MSDFLDVFYHKKNKNMEASGGSFSEFLSQLVTPSLFVFTTNFQNNFGALIGAHKVRRLT